MVKKLYEKGNERLEEEVNLVWIVKEIRKLKALAECSTLSSQQREFLLDHGKNNLIDLDSDTDFNQIDRHSWYL